MAYQFLFSFHFNSALVDIFSIFGVEIGFTYIKGMKFAKNIIFGANAPPGCNCQGKCTDPRTCACAKLNGGDFPYVHSHGGRWETYCN